MKKIITLALAAVMLVAALTGCGAKKTKLTILDTEYAVEDYAVCVAKENTEFLEKINTALSELTGRPTASLQPVLS